MSIDLHLRIGGHVSIRERLPLVANYLNEILGYGYVENLVLEVLCEGNRLLAEDDVLKASNTMFLVSIPNEPEVVGLLSNGEEMGVIMGAQRSALEYLLGASVAIAFSTDMTSLIEDDWMFFSSSPTITANELLHQLKYKGPLNVLTGLRERSEALNALRGSKKGENA